MYYVGCMMSRTGFYIMSLFNFLRKTIIVLDLFHILGCQPVFGFTERK
jgi:hypothetical protein